MRLIYFVLFGFGFSWAHAEQYQRFDGQTYNGLYYPRIDIVEWGKPLHLEFHVYQKDKPVDVSGTVIERGGKKVFKFAYDLGYRGERRCRAVPAPPGWKVGQKLNFYFDPSDHEMNRIIVSAEPMKKKSYEAQAYNGCTEVAAHSVKKPQQTVSTKKQLPQSTAGSPKPMNSKEPKQKAATRQVASQENGAVPTEKEKTKEDVAKAEKEDPNAYGSDLKGKKDFFWFSDN